MNAEIKIKSKMLLLGNTARLFFISFVSFIIRYGLIAGNVYLFYHIISFAENLYFIAIPIVTSILSLGFVCSIRLGEQYIYYIRATGGSGRFLLLFRFFKPKDCLKGELLYLKLNVLKLLWLVYFSVPAVFLGISYYILNKNVTLDNGIDFVILTALGIMIALAVVFSTASFIRLSAAPYYFFCDERRCVNRAIKKSIDHTDSILSEGVVHSYSFSGWILSCLLLVPIIYVVPYIKLSKTLFLVTSIEEKSLAHSKTPIIFTAYKSMP